MNIDSIRNGTVIDHITAGSGMTLYRLLSLDSLGCPVAIIMNAQSSKLGKKDMIKIDGEVDLDLNVIGFVDPGATVNIIKDGALDEKKQIGLPETIKNVVKCKNPRCISSVEQELPDIFRLTDRKSKTYRCIYCESKYSG